MALDADALAAIMKTNCLANPATGVQPNAATDAFLAAIAAAVVTHIQSAGVVAVVTACPAGAGTGTGTVG